MYAVSQDLKSTAPDLLTLDLKRITSKGIISGSSFQVPLLADMLIRFGFSPLGGGADSASAREQQQAALQRLTEALQELEEASCASDAAQQVAPAISLGIKQAEPYWHTLL